MYTDTGNYHNFMAPLDTLSIAKTLEAAGTPKKQAEAHAKMWGEHIQHNLATKADVNALKEDVKAVKDDVNVLKDDMKAVKEDVKDIKKDIRGMEARLESKIQAAVDKGTLKILWWLIPLMGIHFSATIGVVARLLHWPK